MSKQEMRRKVRNAMNLHKRGFLSAEQTVRLCKEYRLRYERSA